MKARLLSLALLSSLSLSAQTGEEELYIQLREADTELYELCNKLKAKLTNSKDKKAFIKSQRAWEKYRERHCLFLSKEKTERGVIANKMKLDCQTQLAEERAAVIKELMEDF